MLIGPLYQTPDWNYLQNVWDRWQSFNVGILAFLTSLLVYRATQYQAERQRERQYAAMRAMLPFALSELTSYIKASAKSLDYLWELKDSGFINKNKRLKIKYPEVPFDALKTFKECITFADELEGQQLAKILMGLQIFEARLVELCTFHSTSNDSSKSNIENNIVYLAEIFARVNESFKFARNLEPATQFIMTKSKYNEAYALLDLEVGSGFDKYGSVWDISLKRLDNGRSIPY